MKKIEKPGVGRPLLGPANTVSELKFCCKNKCVSSSIWHKVHDEKNIGRKKNSMKKKCEKIMVTHKESRGNSWRKHTLNKNLYYI